MPCHHTFGELCKKSVIASALSECEDMQKKMHYFRVQNVERKIIRHSDVQIILIKRSKAVAVISKNFVEPSVCVQNTWIAIYF